MEALKRIALLLVGLGAGEMLAASNEEETSPIFVTRAPVIAENFPTKASPVQTPVGRELASLIRSDVAANQTDTPSAAVELGQGEVSGNTLQLEKMTVEARRILAPPLRETPLEKFTRTGYLWEFSTTKRFMIGPKGDKVGVMFSFDW